MSFDAQAHIGPFYASSEWKEAKEGELFKRKKGLEKAIRTFLKRAYGIPEKQHSEDVEKGVGLLAQALRKRWAEKSVRTKQRKKARAERDRKRKRQERKRKILRLAKRFHKKHLEQRERELRPSFFQEDLPVQHRPVNPNKPPRKVA